MVFCTHDGITGEEFRKAAEYFLCWTRRDFQGLSKDDKNTIATIIEKLDSSSLFQAARALTSLQRPAPHRAGPSSSRPNRKKRKFNQTRGDAGSPVGAGVEANTSAGLEEANLSAEGADEKFRKTNNVIQCGSLVSTSFGQGGHTLDIDANVSSAVVLKRSLDIEHGPAVQRDEKADQFSTVHDENQARQRDSGYSGSGGEDKQLSRGLTFVDLTLNHAQSPSQPINTSNTAILSSTELIEAFLASKFNLTVGKVQHVIRDACNPALFRQDLCKLLLTNYCSWQQNGIWSQDGIRGPLSDSVSKPAQRVAHLINMGKMNENKAAVYQVRDFIILHLFLKEYNSLSSVQSELLEPGKRGATAAIDKLLYNHSCTRNEVARMLQRSRRLERFTQNLGIAIVLAGGPHLSKVLRSSQYSNDMYDCLNFYIIQKLPHISNTTGILQDIATRLVMSARLPPWNIFREILVQLAAGPLLDMQAADFSTQDIESWAVKHESRESNFDLTAHDIQTILPGQQFNNVIVDCALQLLLSQISLPNGEQKFYVWESFLFTEFAAREDVSQRKTKAVMKSLNEYNFHLIPIYHEARWMLARVDLRHQAITIFDSASCVGIEQSVFTNLQRWVDEDVSDIKQQVALQYMTCKEIPQAENRCDSGVIMLWVASRLMREMTIDEAEAGIVDWVKERECIARWLYRETSLY